MSRQQGTDWARKPPAPYPGGKAKAAPIIWALLGDPAHYVEPFCGMAAVLLNRPHECNRTYYSETINDACGWVVNALRAIQLHPEATAEAASWPVTEADKIARQVACCRWRDNAELEHLMGDATWCDPLIAGYWLYGVACQIGFFTGDGPWTVDRNTGRLYRQPRGPFREWGAAPDDDREPGVSRNRPHLHDDGQGANTRALAEPGVAPPADADLVPLDAADFHPLVMPKLLAWFRLLAARLRHVRIVNGDWRRVVTHGALYTLSVGKKGPAGVFLDPPYSNAQRASGLYAEDDGSVAADVLAWCHAHGTDPDLRIVLAGYKGEHDSLVEAGWREYEWFKGGFLTGGMANTGGSGKHQQHRERLWASPQCLDPEAAEQAVADTPDDCPLFPQEQAE